MNRIGVTGHRTVADPVAVSNAVETALQHIEMRAAGQPLVVLSALAEGADRLVAERVLARPGSRLIVPLPLARSDYRNDFTTAQSRHEFQSLLDRADEIIELPKARTRSAAYRAAGIYVLDHSDVLVALWDGRPGRGRSGTAGIVHAARRRGHPLIWVHTEQAGAPGARHATTIAPTPTVTFEGIP